MANSCISESASIDLPAELPNARLRLPWSWLEVGAIRKRASVRMSLREGARGFSGCTDGCLGASEHLPIELSTLQAPDYWQNVTPNRKRQESGFPRSSYRTISLPTARARKNLWFLCAPRSLSPNTSSIKQQAPSHPLFGPPSKVVPPQSAAR